MDKTKGGHCMWAQHSFFFFTIITFLFKGDLKTTGGKKDHLKTYMNTVSQFGVSMILFLFDCCILCYLILFLK